MLLKPEWAYDPEALQRSRAESGFMAMQILRDANLFPTRGHRA